jgi:protein-tyrosine phosphatase
MTDQTEYYSKIIKVLRRAEKRNLFTLVGELNEQEVDDPPFTASLLDSYSLPFDIWLGSVSDAMYPKALKNHNIVAIVNVAAGQCAEIQRIEGIAGNGSQWERIEFCEEWYKLNCNVSSFQYLAIPAEDHPKYKIENDFNTVIDFFNNIRSNKEEQRQGVLIHCVQGLNRSAAVSVALLMKVKSISALEAIELIAAKRPGILTNRAFVKKLIAYEQSLAPPVDVEDRTRKVFSIGNIVER